MKEPVPVLFVVLSPDARHVYITGEHIHVPSGGTSNVSKINLETGKIA